MIPNIRSKVTAEEHPKRSGFPPNVKGTSKQESRPSGSNAGTEQGDMCVQVQVSYETMDKALHFSVSHL